ncbi:MAG: DNA repair exonuclease [Actinobacteria bacterium]|jgi:DNA repair exonuclease SbcCD nuclease subunit|nr:DNA repair exonuclease [Actinomycetota bacterium]
MRFRFVHAADLHLDTPFEGLARVSADMAELLRDASLQAFDNLIRVALEREAAFVLLAGDLYDGEQRGVRAQLRFLQGVQRLAERGVHTFVVHGNHDPLGAWSAVRSWPEEVTFFGSDEVIGVPVEVAGERVATVYGLSYGRREVAENLALRFPRAGGEASPRDRREAGTGFRIGLLHCSVGDQPEHSPYSPCSLADLRGAAIDYWALGHIHRAVVLSDDRPWVVYPGNTQGRSPKPAEMGVKGAVIVEVDGDQVRTVESVSLDAVRFIDIRLDVDRLGEEADLGEVRAELLGRAVTAREEHEGRALLARATLHGGNPGGSTLHRDLTAPGAVADLLRDLRDSLSDTDPPFWWESIKLATRPLLDLDVIRARDDFSSNLLTLAETAADDPCNKEQLLRALTPTAPAELVRRYGAPSAEDLPRLLEEAALLALEALESEASACD